MPNMLGNIWNAAEQRDWESVTLNSTQTIASLLNTVHVFLEITYLKEEYLAPDGQWTLRPLYPSSVLAKDWSFTVIPLSVVYWQLRTVWILMCVCCDPTVTTCSIWQWYTGLYYICGCYCCQFKSSNLQNVILGHTKIHLFFMDHFNLQIHWEWEKLFCGFHIIVLVLSTVHANTLEYLPLCLPPFGVQFYFHKGIFWEYDLENT